MEKLIPRLKELHKIAFGDSDEYIDFFYEKRFSPENCYLAYESGKPVSAVYVRHFTLNLYGERFTVPFFTGIATHPDHRNKHLASSLINKALAEFTEKGAPFALLHPFNADFYRRLGFEAVSYAEPFTVKYYPNPQYIYRPLAPADTVTALGLYRSRCEYEVFYKVRNEKDYEEQWQEHFHDGGLGYLIFKNGIPYGYVLCSEGKISEYIGESPSALNAVKELDGMTGKIPGSGEIYTMAALCDPAALMKLVRLRDTAGYDGVFSLENETYRLTAENGKIIGFEKSDKAPDFTMDKRQFISAVLGGERYRGELPRDFTDIFPRYGLFMYDKY